MILQAEESLVFHREPCWCYSAGGMLVLAALLAMAQGGARPSTAEEWKKLGVSYASQGKHEEAGEPFREACRMAPDDPDACYFHGRNLYALNRFGSALKVLEEQLRRRSDGRVLLAAAQALEALGRASESEGRFEDAIRSTLKPLRPEDDPRLHYGVFLIRQGRAKEAVQELVRAQPSARALAETGRALSQLDRTAEAAAALEKALALDPRHWTAHLLLGKAYLRLGRAAEAEPHLRLGEKGLTTEGR